MIEQFLLLNGRYICIGFFLILSLIIFLYSKHRLICKILKSEKELGKRRNIWDLCYFPGICRAILKADWHFTFSVLLLVFLCIFYLIIREKELLSLILVNSGAIIGSLIKQDSSNKDELIKQNEDNQSNCTTTGA